MKYGSGCSGIEAATVAWHPLGFAPAWFAEIDPFCCALLKHHYPEVPNLGDFTHIRREAGHVENESQPANGRGKSHPSRFASDSVPERSKSVESNSIDLLVGGTPCQDFSVAGLRAGMGGARGQLTVELIALAGRLRPRWLVWENVPGILSIDQGRAFGMFLGGLGKLGYGVAYRVLDAQYFGVPQRRRRVFVVGHLGDWRRAAAVLFERESLSGHPAPSREAREDVAHCLRDSSARGGDTEDRMTFVADTARVAPTLDVAYDGDPMFTLQRGAQHGVMQSGVRRLTPRECERLQGFPDDYTAVPYRGKLAADGPRYRALGNSMAVPVMVWIGKRIAMVEGL